MIGSYFGSNICNVNIVLLFLVPTTAPTNLDVSVVNSSAVKVAFDPPPQVSWNGRLDGVRVLSNFNIFSEFFVSIFFNLPSLCLISPPRGRGGGVLLYGALGTGDVPQFLGRFLT